jgi:hypothetical protein
MTEWAMVIMLCLNAVPHDQCNKETAVWVMRPAERYSTTIGCAVASMQMLPVMEDADDSTHPLIACEARKRQGNS